MKHAPKVERLSAAAFRADGISPPAVLGYATRSPSYWHSGRTAIFQAIRRLGLQEGDRVLVPAYCCGSEVDALLKSGVTVQLYRVCDDLSPDFDDLRRLAEPAAALYVIHYFGVAQDMPPLAALCQARGLRLIEDAALALYAADSSGQPVATTGDAGILSFTKFVPLPDGGALLAGPGEEYAPGPARGPDLRVIAGRVKGLLKQTVTRSLQRNPSADERADPPMIGNTERSGGLEPGRGSWRMSRVSRWLFRTYDHERGMERRQRNTAFLQALLDAEPIARPLLRSWPEDAAPPFFPLLTDEPVLLFRHLRGHGVEAVPFWRSRHPQLGYAEFPFEQALKEHVLRLPIHPGIDEETIGYVAQLINEWSARRRRVGVKSSGISRREVARR